MEQSKKILIDSFAEGFLSTSHIQEQGYKLIRHEGDIYVFGKNEATYDNPPLPKSGGFLAVAYLKYNSNIILVDKSCVIPINNEFVLKNSKRMREDKEYLLGFSAGCLDFSNNKSYI